MTIQCVVHSASRTRHTRSKRDWSSDVCSSDLNKKFSLLFIAQGKGFISKGGIEVVNTFIQLEKKIKNIELNIITSNNDIPPKILLKINNSENINLIEFGISYDELKKYYIESNVLIHLTR